MSPATLALTLALAAAAPPGPLGSTVIEAGAGRPRLILAPRAGVAPSMIIRFDAGSVSDDRLVGLTRLTQRVLLENNAALPYETLLVELFRANASLELRTELRQCAFELRAPAAEFTRLATKVGGALLAPRLDRYRYVRAKARTLHGLKQGSDLVSQITAAVVEDPRYANDPFGRPEHLETIKFEDVAHYAAGHLAPGNATVILAGAFDAPKLKAFFSRFKGGARLELPRPALALPFEARIPGQRELHLLAYRADLASAARSAAFRILTALLQDRLHYTFRQRGIGYSVGVEGVHRPEADLMLIVLPAEKASTSLEGMLFAAVDEVRTGRFSDEEYEASRSWVERQLRLGDTVGPTLAGELASDGGGGDWYGPAVLQRVAAMPRAEFLEHVGGWLDRENSFYALFTPMVTSVQVTTLREKSEKAAKGAAR